MVRVRGASVAPIFHWAGHRKNTTYVSSPLELTVNGIMVYTIPGAQEAEVPPVASLSNVPPEAHLSSPKKKN